MKKRFGFTLAEVLITLGIIGVVAAMTIPTLIQNTNSTRFVTQFKKSVSTLSQAALMAQAQYDIDYSLLGTVSTNCAGEALSNGNNTICGLLNNTLTGQTYLGTYGTNVAATFRNAAQDAQYTITTSVLPSPAGWFIFALADGSYVGINNAAENCGLAEGQVLTTAALQAASGEGQNATPAGALRQCLGFIDVNGGALPNREITCETAANTALDPSAVGNCTISMTGGAMGDVFPIVFHNGTVEPASNAAKLALTRGK